MNPSLARRGAVAAGLLVTVAVAGCSGDRVTPEPAGAWTKLGAGATTEATWAIHYTDASNDGICLSLDLNPSPFKTDPPPGKKHDGRPAACVFRADEERPVKTWWGAEVADMGYRFLAGLGRDPEATYSGLTSEQVLPNLLGESESSALGMAIFLFIYPADESLEAVSVEPTSGAPFECATDWSAVRVIDRC